MLPKHQKLARTQEWNRKVARADGEDSHLLQLTARPPRPNRAGEIGVIQTASFILLISVILIQAGILIHWRIKLAESPQLKDIFGLQIAPNTLRSSGLLNKYWQGDELEGPNKAWDSINSGHGVIVLTPEFVERNNLPKTMRHPHDNTKFTYALEAYHMVHCIQVLRRDYLLIREGKTPTKPLEHAMHCFDALRQSVMCQANDELLIITGQGHANGFNQTRRCRDWDALRDFATANTACYWDDELPDGEESRWAMCDRGYDGLPKGGILE